MITLRVEALYLANRLSEHLSLTHPLVISMYTFIDSLTDGCVPCYVTFRTHKLMSIGDLEFPMGSSLRRIGLEGGDRVRTRATRDTSCRSIS